MRTTRTVAAGSRPARPSTIQEGGVGSEGNQRSSRPVTCAKEPGSPSAGTSRIAHERLTEARYRCGPSPVMRTGLRILLTGALLLSAPAVAGAADVRLGQSAVAGSAAVRAPFGFDLVGARWKGSGRVELRTRPDSGRFGRWQVLLRQERTCVRLPACRSPSRCGPVRPCRAATRVWIRARAARDLRRTDAADRAGLPLSAASLNSQPTILHARRLGGEREPPPARRCTRHPSAWSSCTTPRPRTTTARPMSAAIMRSIYAYHVQATGGTTLATTTSSIATARSGRAATAGSPATWSAPRRSDSTRAVSASPTSATAGQHAH